ncbi:hypothetical protein FAZ95_07245 [Trinickia violacea]|uniref:JmjC domain-containing protein n=1 Tax=Trinickia violacea TaxID=2571746 RepID=A0A4P8INA5_9BURK|nr:hypothetical protein [Trinickia violacea]QCP48995.1 hypothetical protein FAZ95_07245 [Trinickia violacea]
MEIIPGWASRLVAESKGLTRPVRLVAAMPGHVRMLNAVSRMFTRFSPQELPRVRAWVQGGQRYTITDALVALANRTDLTLDQRLATANESAEYCTTLNGLSGWCPQFTELMRQEVLIPLFDALGAPPACGADFYAFFGNYGYTPFGVHDDVDQSLLWHLGPASKTAYIWPRQRYFELTGGTLSTTDYSLLLPHALRYELQPGDLLFIPMGDFHVLQTREFSTTLGLTLFPDDPMLECAEGLRLFAPNAKSFAAVANQSVTLQELAELRRMAVRSNNYLITPPELSTVARASYDEAVLRNSALRAHSGWPLLHTRLANRAALLVRRRLIWGRPNALFAALCEMLNGAERLPFESLRQRVAGTIQCAAVVELVQSVSRLGGLTIEPL